MAASTQYHYFRIMTGLRGCYMPDQSYVVKAKTRTELREILSVEAEHQSCDGQFIGLSKTKVAWAAHHAWNNPQTILPFGMKIANLPYSIEIVQSSYREYRREQALEAV